MKKNQATLFVYLATLFLAGCINNEAPKQSVTNVENSPTPDVVQTPWYQPPPGVTWHWQLQGELDTTRDAKIYDIDLFNTPVETINELHTIGKKVICYFSAGSYEDFRPDSDVFSATDLGNPLDGWPGEKWLDIRSQTVRDIMAARILLAATKGCDGIEPDNVDGYVNNSGFPLTAEDQIGFNLFIAAEAHHHHLSVGLKNDLDQISLLVDHFDFAVNEQCFEYNECQSLLPFIDKDKAVLNAEYDQQYIKNRHEPDGICYQAQELGLSTLILPIALDDTFQIDCLKD
ncbi:MAG: endo alpha-1,4 polygalactosaminidase [Thiotrichales bacterium]